MFKTIHPMTDADREFFFSTNESTGFHMVFNIPIQESPSSKRSERWRGMEIGLAVRTALLSGIKAVAA